MLWQGRKSPNFYERFAQKNPSIQDLLVLHRLHFPTHYDEFCGVFNSPGF